MGAIAERYYSYGNGYYYSTPWERWGRWVVLAVIIVGAFFLFLICACISARRRRRRGLQPFRGTGWAGAGPQGHPQQFQPPPGQGQQQYPSPNPQQYPQQYPQQHPQQYPPQQYPPQQGGVASPPPQYGTAQDYYAPQQTGVELQQPPNAYGGQPYGHKA
ncbi:uncharacterized protein GIQ15_03720 [Arthroderma uncinatum]|uniref:uncharacterized protein n=1 Tax=Arthroderma uncinatum TaxID=74035 RepID=UPI00144AAE09|nr:uncharacterized protein GIQ15_03720 [Arthroderma uncinatum]KAF3484396.1 hypothetical protein GIQ15_03720 [Arthroderma uncinatum]